MKRSFFLLSLAALAIGVFAFIPKEGDDKKDIETIAIGTVAPKLNYTMKDVEGKEHMLRALAKDKGLLVVFSCNTCPFVVAWQDRYNELFDLCQKNNIGMVLVNSNEAKRKGDDSVEKMKAHAEKNNYKALYVVDENHELADAFGAKTTPHVFLFNNQFSLVYKGAIDDNYKDKEAVEETYLKNAIEQMAGDKEVDVKETKALGCSIKRV